MQILYSPSSDRYRTALRHSNSLEDPPDRPHVTERIDHRALEHSPDRLRPFHVEPIFRYRVVLHRFGGQRHLLNRDGVMAKQFYANGGKTCRRRPSLPTLRRLVREKELVAADRQPGDNLFLSSFQSNFAPNAFP